MNMTGERVMLRPICTEDADILCAWKNDEQTYMYLGGGYQPVSREQYGKWMENMIDQTGNSRRFIIQTSACEPIGMVGLYEIHWIHRTCEIGMLIGSAEHRGKGLASEAYTLIEAYAKNYLNLRKIRLKAVCDNEAAVAFWQKQGYRPVGVLHRERYINGKYCDVALMEKFL